MKETDTGNNLGYRMKYIGFLWFQNSIQYFELVLLSELELVFVTQQTLLQFVFQGYFSPH